MQVLLLEIMHYDITLRFVTNAKTTVAVLTVKLNILDKCLCFAFRLYIQASGSDIQCGTPQDI